MPILTKKVIVKIFAPDNKRFEKIQYQAPSGSGFTAVGVDDCLERAVIVVEAKYPDYEYSLVPLHGVQYNFVCAGKKDETTQTA